MPEPAGIQPGLVTVLAPLSALYGAAVAVRGMLYDIGLLRTRRLTVPVVSVGNLTAGGTGKSPMVAFIARLLAAGGARPAVVSRGYGGDHAAGVRVVSEGSGALLDAAAAGDEPVMLARLLEGVPVLIARDRRLGGETAVSRFGARCVILDDGFQHRALARSLDLLLLDGAEPFGGGRLLPSGMLREPVRAMARAGALVVTRTDRADARTLETVASQAARHCPRAPIFHARARLAGLSPLNGTGPLVPVERLRGARAVCFAGIARPDRFFEDVAAAGCEVVASFPFPDHHRFTAPDLSRVRAAARDASADRILTTEKDAARLPGAWRESLGETACALRVETIVDEMEPFTVLLRQAVA